MLIYTPVLSNRLKYTCTILSGILDQEFKLVGNMNDIVGNSELVVSYSETPLNDTFHIHPFGLLSEQEIHKQVVPIGTYEKITTLFHTGKGDIPFDIFSAVFYMVSRYEEYLPFEGDVHGRFRAEDSIAFRQNFHRLPIVEIWCKLLAEKLQIPFQQNNFKLKLTVDVDNAWMHRNKGFWRSTGGFAKLVLNRNWPELFEKVKVLTGKMPDPSYTFGYLKSLENRLKEPIQYFILCNSHGKYDKAISLKNREFRKLLQSLDEKTSLGLHPSYKSFDSVIHLEKEFFALSAVFQRKVVKSRQHYLLLKFPETYRNLMKLGIREDYTLGWSSQTGFRAGISRPFAFYDLLAEKETNLLLVPFVAMDRTLQKYLMLSPKQALSELKELADITKSVGGEFVLLWHNDSVGESCEWVGWRTVLEQIIEYAG